MNVSLMNLGHTRRKLLMAFVLAATLAALLFATGTQTAYADSTGMHQYSCDPIGNKNAGVTEIFGVGLRDGHMWKLTMADDEGNTYTAICLDMGNHFYGDESNEYEGGGSYLTEGYSSVTNKGIDAAINWYKENASTYGDDAYIAAQLVVWGLISYNWSTYDDASFSDLISTVWFSSEKLMANGDSLYTFNIAESIAGTVESAMNGDYSVSNDLSYWNCSTSGDQQPVVTWGPDGTVIRNKPVTGSGGTESNWTNQEVTVTLSSSATSASATWTENSKGRVATITLPVKNTGTTSDGSESRSFDGAYYTVYKASDNTSTGSTGYSGTSVFSGSISSTGTSFAIPTTYEGQYGWVVDLYNDEDSSVDGTDHYYYKIITKIDITKPSSRSAEDVNWEYKKVSDNGDSGDYKLIFSLDKIIEQNPNATSSTGVSAPYNCSGVEEAWVKIVACDMNGGTKGTIPETKLKCTSAYSGSGGSIAINTTSPSEEKAVSYGSTYVKFLSNEGNGDNVFDTTDLINYDSEYIKIYFYIKDWAGNGSNGEVVLTPDGDDDDPDTDDDTTDPDPTPSNLPDPDGSYIDSSNNPYARINTFYLRAALKNVSGNSLTWAGGDQGLITWVTGEYVDSVDIEFTDDYLVQLSQKEIADNALTYDTDYEINRRDLSKRTITLLGSLIRDVSRQGTKLNSSTAKDPQPDGIPVDDKCYFYLPVTTPAYSGWPIVVTAHKDKATRTATFYINTDGDISQYIRTQFRNSN